MNMETIKQFFAIQQALKEEGVIGLDIWNKDVHLYYDELAVLPNLQVKAFNDGEFPYEFFTTIDGIRFHSLFTDERLEKYPFLKKLAEELKKEEELPFADESILEDDVYFEDMRSEEYVSSFDLKVGEGL